MSLAINARDELPDGGQFMIETHAVTLGDTSQTGVGLIELNNANQG
ncbi:MAG: hypothetical protein H0W76_23510 [Pyrinomonadaceae bacterium]|nr:hypothetical protein [Pyrinomonadaceae bacterium]